MTYDPEKPYQELPLLPPEEIELESKAILRALVKAHGSLAALEERCSTLPNASVLIAAIPLLEAQASSEIENIMTTTDELFKSLATGGTNDNLATKETMRYREALWEGFNSLEARPLTAQSTSELCTILRGVKTDFRTNTGTRIANAATGKILYSPPEGQHVILDKLSNWEKFYHHETELHPLIRMAVCHYQFEAIHPFVDGNGRTGRIINVLILIEQGLLSNPVLFLSQYIIENKQKYYTLLNKVTTHDAWEEWILFMLDAVHTQSQRTLKKIKLIKEQQDTFTQEMKDKAPKVYNRDLIDLLFELPYCRIDNLVEAKIVERHAAGRQLNKLVELGLLDKIHMGRTKLFINTGFMNVLKEDA
ncbi:MAG: Fic/DOC family N-terminal domain-containing protein [Micrococcaceae bacterium]